MSALLTMTMVEMPNVIDSLKEAGLKGKMKVMIGGAPIIREFAEDFASAVDEAARLMNFRGGL